jgi:membrane protease YdiL (CAAX protease family)
MAEKPRMAPTDRRRLITYYAIACGWTWALWIPGIVHSARTGITLPTLIDGMDAWSALSTTDLIYAVMFQLAVYGPLIAALAVLLFMGSRLDLRNWARSLVRIRVNWRWYAFVALWPLAIALLVVLIASAMAGQAPSLPTATLLAPLPLAFVVQLFTSGLEEPGWRGYALPLISKTRDADRANWLLGLLWAAWHFPFVIYLNLEAPLFAIPLTLAGFTMSIIAMTFVHAWVYYSTGSVFLSILLHSWANVTNPLAASLLPDDPAAAGMSGIATAGLAWLFVVWLNRRYGRATLRASADSPWKVPESETAT